VAGQAIDVFLGLEVEVGILPAVADVAAVAGGFVRGDRNAEVVDDGLLAQRLLGLGIEVFPFPVLGAVDLAGGLGVAGSRQALVTSGPELKVFCSSLNLVWSAVVVSLSGLGSIFTWLPKWPTATRSAPG
jgi:hypothetical protein